MISNCVAMFVDYENIHWTAQNDYARYPDGDIFGKLFTTVAKDKGNLLISKAYADWSYFQEMQSALSSYGFDPIFVASKLRSSPEKGARKNSSDLEMAIDVMETLYTRTEIETFVFFTGDRDFLNLVKKLKNKGKRIVVCSFQTSMSDDLARAAHEVVSIDTFLRWEPIVKRKKIIAAEKPADNWKPLVKRILNLHKLPSIHWHYIRKHMYWKEVKIESEDRKEQDAYLNRAREAGIIRVEKVPNCGPNKERFPYVSAIILNNEHPLVERLVEEIRKENEEMRKENDEECTTL